MNITKNKSVDAVRFLSNSTSRDWYINRSGATIGAGGVMYPPHLQVRGAALVYKQSLSCDKHQFRLYSV